MRFFIAAFSLGLGAATLISCVVIISATAVSILVRRNSCDSGNLASESKGTAISFPPVLRSHSLIVARWMLSKMEIGVASWTSGIGPREYLSMVLRAGCFPFEALSLAASSRRSKTVGFLADWGVSGSVVSPRALTNLGACCSLIVVVARVSSTVVGDGATWVGLGAMVTSRSVSVAGCGVFTTVLGYRKGEWGG